MYFIRSLLEPIVLLLDTPFITMDEVNKVSHSIQIDRPVICASLDTYFALFKFYILDLNIPVFGLVYRSTYRYKKSTGIPVIPRNSRLNGVVIRMRPEN